MTYLPVVCTGEACARLPYYRGEMLSIDMSDWAEALFSISEGYFTRRRRAVDT